MEILEPGRVPSGKLRGRCNHCRCAVRCTQAEATTLADGPGYSHGVRCPTPGCWRWITLTPEEARRDLVEGA